MSPHPIVHIEFSAVDREQAGKFYQELFGWQIQHEPDFNYTTFRTTDQEGDVGGGINTASDNYPLGSVVFYVDTDDIEASLAKAESLGGKTIMPCTGVGEMGWIAMFLDPSGNKIGLWKTAPVNDSPGASNSETARAAA